MHHCLTLIGRLLEDDCILPRGEEFEVGAVGICEEIKEIIQRDQTHLHTRTHSNPRALAAGFSAMRVLCASMHPLLPGIIPIYI